MTVRVLHVVPSFAPAFRYGGPIQSVLRLCQSLAGAGVELQVATTNTDGPSVLDVPTDRFVDHEGVQVRYFARTTSAGYAFSVALARYLIREVRNFDLVHVTSTFSFPATMAEIAARRAGRPYVVSPRGSLQQWALGQKRWKKVPYWTLIERGNLRTAAALHATSTSEADDIQGVLPGAPVFIVPNGCDAVSVPEAAREPARVVFLGRIHKKKGFDVLVPALSEVARAIPEVETIVAGPDQDGEWRRIEQNVEKATPRPRVRYVGPVYGEEKYRLLASATVFVLPSHSENFGISVVEAMACGTPVVVSRNCPWEEVRTSGAGHWVENTPEAVASAILQVLKDRPAAKRMSQAGRALARKYSWPELGRSMAREYQMLVGKGARL